MLRKLILGMCVLSSSLAFSEFIKKTEWSGVVMLDQNGFNTNKFQENKLFNHASLRKVDLGLSIAIKENTTLNIEFDGAKKMDLDLVFLDWNLSENSNFSLGQIPSPFCLAMSSSSKWLPFLERSVAVSAFQPCVGPGLGYGYWSDSLLFRIAIKQPSYGHDNSNLHDDPWGGSIKGVWSPLNRLGEHFHLGFSFSYQPMVQNTLEFKSKLEINSRAITSSVLSTGAMSSHDYKVLSVDSAVSMMGFEVEGEYLRSFVSRRSGDNVSFYGAYGQLVYNLFGATRPFSMVNGSFGKMSGLKDASKYQVGYRYSILDLNDKDIKGGKELSQNIVANYFYDQNLRFSLTYVIASASKQLDLTQDVATEKVGIISFRTQVVF